MKRLKKGLFGLLFSLCIGLLSGCGGTGGGGDGILRECSNEMSAFSAFNYIRNTTLLSQQSQMDEKDILSFKLLSGSSTCEDDPSKEGKGRVFITFQYTIQGNKIEISESFDVIDYGIVKYIGMEQTVISNPKLEPLCPDVPKNDSRYVDIKLVNKAYQDYIKTGQLNIEKAKFTIRFFNEEQLLETKTTGWRGQVFYTGATPTKEEDNQYIYQFSSWSHSLTNIKSDLDVYAIFSNMPSHYNVTFVNDDGETLQTNRYKIGTMPEYEGELPTRDSDGQYTYKFDGWEPEIHKVTENQVYTAKYKKIKRDLYYTANYDNTATIVGYNPDANKIIIPSTIRIGTNDYNVTGIGNYAFKNAIFLDTIIIPDNITSIGSGAFSGCSSLNSIAIPSSVEMVGSNVFSGCTSLETIYCKVNSQPNGWDVNWNGSNGKVYWGTFQYETTLNGLKFLIENNEAVVIGYTTDLSEDVIIPSAIIFNNISYHVTSIGSEAFKNCSTLKSIVIPNGVKNIGDYAFASCASLNSITIPNSVMRIGNKAFYKCETLELITIPESVQYMGEYAFEDTFPKIFCEASSQPNGWDEFWNPYQAPVYWGVTQEDIIHQGSWQYLIIDGNAMIYKYEGNASNVIIPSNILVDGISYEITEIADSSFASCTSLTSITIPNNILRIDAFAFFDCTKLKSVTFEEESKLTSIGEGAFYNCQSLTSIVIPNSVTWIGWSAFENCRSLHCNEYGNCLYLGNEDNPYLVLVKAKDTIKEATIRENTRFILDDAFVACSSLTSVTFEEGSKLENIGSNAFSGCTSLTSIVIPNNVTSIGAYAFYGCSSLTIYCEASTQPSGWDSYWNEDIPVYWAEEWFYVNGVPTANQK